MVRHTTDADDESTNDLTKFLHARSAAADEFADVDADVSASFTARKDSWSNGNDDFDGGDYVADDPVFVEVELTVDVANDDQANGRVMDLMKTATDRGFDVTDTDWSGYFRANVDTSGTFAQPTTTKDEAERYKVTVTARRHIGGPSPEDDDGDRLTPIDNDRIVGAV